LVARSGTVHQVRPPADGFTLKVGNPWFSWHYVTSNAATIESAAREHVTLTLLSVGIGFLLALPLAVIGTRSGLAKAAVFGISTALYAIPSLAAIVALYPIFGLSRWTVVLPLAMYSLIILVRNMVTGLDGVPVDAIDAAVGMGMSPRAVFLRVRLPLAVPTIIAGLRLATVATIELVVIGGFVGSGGFGEYILEGLHDNDYHAEIMTFLILTILLALVADLLLLGLQWLVTPWQRGVSG
jgi:osmoprotectant transport system permease protein